MANTISTAFIKQFESEVHIAYQRMGSKLRNTVRTVSNVSGNVVRFQKIGTGSASTKSRNGLVTPMELAHTNVECTMADFYAAEYIDKLDELKTNIDERQAVAKSAAAALGRKTDELILNQMTTTTSAHDETSNGITIAWALGLMEAFGNNECCANYGNDTLCPDGTSQGCDECGICDNNPSNDNSTCLMDCAFVWGGISIEDLCGVCDDNPNNDNTTCTQDCASVWGGSCLLYTSDAADE